MSRKVQNAIKKKQKACQKYLLTKSRNEWSKLKKEKMRKYDS